jgi:D-alanyl-D-alanine carboxypeptidase
MKRLLCLVMVLLLLPLSAPAQSAVMLRVGSTGADVVTLQKRLIELGFLAGMADGKYGNGTATAVSRAQSALRERGHTLSVDGVAGPQTLALLYDNTAMRDFLDLKMGSRGQRVTELQNRLYDLKFLNEPADGQFGGKTEEALKAFQRVLASGGAAEIQVNGIADEATRNMLKQNLAGFGIQAPEFFDEENPGSLQQQFLYARTAVLLSGNTGEVLFAKGAEERMYPASTTKIMTLLLAVEKGNLDRMVTVPASAAQVPKDSSLVPVYPGEQMTMRNLLYGLMIRSGNDAANAVAEIVSGSVQQFVEEMNRKAQALGMADTHFVNPHGYHDANHYTTARDLAILSRYAMANNAVVRIAAATHYTLPATKLRGELPLTSTTELLQPLSPQFYQGAYGIKSGFTRAAGFCYTGAAAKGDTTLIAVVLFCRTRGQAWADMKHLFNYGFSR